MKPEVVHKPELLLPAGNIESFFAALEAGADAVYFGLQQFNARNRASNFTPWQAAALVKIARSRGVKTYITLNTVFRNTETGKMLDTLYQISQIKPDALIIQDIGIQYLVQKFFPSLVLHASTQMAIHNSAGVAYASQSGISRIVLARELALGEMKKIAQKSPVELEVFVHGALCYSFSGLCLFSSFLGGASANRGMCTQPCRRIYRQDKQGQYHFSLKDNQLIDFLPELLKLNIASLKVEGRMKPSDYVFRTGLAYRLVIDHPEKVEEAEKILESDFGREKTSYFIGRDVRNALTHAASTGLLIGQVKKTDGPNIIFTSTTPLETGCRLRFRNPHNDKQIDLKADSIQKNGDDYQFTLIPGEIKQGYEVYLTGTGLKMPTKVNTRDVQIREKIPSDKANKILNSLKGKNPIGKRETFIRIGSPEWLPFIHAEKGKGIIIALSAHKANETLWDQVLSKSKTHSVFAELPKFIPEARIDYYKKRVCNLYNREINHFFLGHISQKMLLPKGASFSCNENVYLFNDTAIHYLKKEGAINYIYPFENDIVNMAKGNDRMGIVPLYFYPHLFYSRMPIILGRDRFFTDSNANRFFKTVHQGMTIVLPEHPVSTLQYREKLERYGFSRFLLDLNHTAPSEEKFKEIWSAYERSEAIKPSSSFNFKRELK